MPWYQSSTTLALLDMLHDWSKGTEGNSAIIRTVLFNYRKAFDPIDHSILIRKICKLNVPNSIINWITDFLSDRSQRIKLDDGWVSEWGSVPWGALQGTKLGPWLILKMINDLVVENVRLWKYVDDTAISETVAKGELSNAQRHKDKVIQWSLENRIQLNTEKYKEMQISFTKSQQEFEPILINGDTLDVVENVKLFGLNVSSNLTWNIHINEIVMKASRRLYFLIQLMRAKLARTDLGLFNSSCIRLIMDYEVPVFHYILPKYLLRKLLRTCTEESNVDRLSWSSLS